MDSKELIGRAQLLFVEGKVKESIEVFREALNAGGDPFLVCLSLGVAFMRLKEYDSAMENLTKAIQINSTNPRPLYYRGLLNMDKDGYEDAVADFTSALELKHDLHFAKFARATAYGRLGDLDRASADFRDVVPLMEENMQTFADSYGIVRTEMWKVMSELSGERQSPTVGLNEGEMEILKKWLEE